MGKKHLPGSGLHQINRRARFDIQTNGDRCIDLGQDYNPAEFKHAEMAGLVQLFREEMHAGQCLCEQTLGWRMLLNQLKKSRPGWARALPMIAMAKQR